MVTQEFVALLVTAGLIGGFLALIVLLLVARHRLRAARRRAASPVAPSAPVALTRHSLMPDDDRTLLEELAAELRGCLVSADGEPLLTDADAVHIATIPVPVIEIEYPDRLVTLRLEVEHYSAEVLA